MTSLTSKYRRSFFAAIAVTSLLTMAPCVSRGGVVFYTTQVDFNAAAPGLPVETFSTVQAGIHSSPLILGGLTVTTLNPGMVTNALEIQGSGANPKAVGTNWFQDTLILNFAPGVSAVGEYAFGNVYPGPSFAGIVTEDVYNGAQLLGSKDESEAAGAGGYIGVTSTTANITSVYLLFNPTADVDSNTYVTEVAFGPTALVPEPSSIVTLSSIAAFLCGLPIVARCRRAISGTPIAKS